MTIKRLFNNFLKSLLLRLLGFKRIFANFLVGDKFCLLSGLERTFDTITSPSPGFSWERTNLLVRVEFLFTLEPNQTADMPTEPGVVISVVVTIMCVGPKPIMTFVTVARFD